MNTWKEWWEAVLAVYVCLCVLFSTLLLLGTAIAGIKQSVYDKIHIRIEWRESK